jgi:hypothetical protein
MVVEPAIYRCKFNLPLGRGAGFCVIR